jgi:hypothetical protein
MPDSYIWRVEPALRYCSIDREIKLRLCMARTNGDAGVGSISHTCHFKGFAMSAWSRIRNVADGS